ncbi:methyltransferase [Leptospira santarosai]|nr:methyltransferase [Leptospira santarosai]MDI7182307.1 methyltransferase [Leptospira santarosai]
MVEVGCGDGFCSRIVKQEVQRLTITDFDPLFIERFADIRLDRWPIIAKVHDILQDSINENFDALYSLDVMEHIGPELEDMYLTNIKRSLIPHGVAIIVCLLWSHSNTRLREVKSGMLIVKQEKFQEIIRKTFYSCISFFYE